MNLSFLKNQRQKIKESVWVEKNGSATKLSDMSDNELEDAIKRIKEKMVTAKVPQPFINLNEGLNQLNTEYRARPRIILRIDTYN